MPVRIETSHTRTPNKKIQGTDVLRSTDQAAVYWYVYVSYSKDLSIWGVEVWRLATIHFPCAYQPEVDIFNVYQVLYPKKTEMEKPRNTAFLLCCPRLVSCLLMLWKAWTDEGGTTHDDSSHSGSNMRKHEGVPWILRGYDDGLIIIKLMPIDYLNLYIHYNNITNTN